MSPAIALCSIPLVFSIGIGAMTYQFAKMRTDLDTQTYECLELVSQGDKRCLNHMEARLNALQTVGKALKQ